jgi:cellulose synthase/poly-beta-1,6-N-acetylglucosamine synthase-like glycosyltransferase
MSEALRWRVPDCSASPDERLHYSINGLADRWPLLSARPREANYRKRIVAAMLVGCFVVSLVVAPIGTGVVTIAVITVIYAAVLAHRLELIRRAQQPGVTVTVSEQDALSIPDDELPVYTVLVPAYREPDVIGSLIENLNALEYPRSRLDVLLLLEEDDEETIAESQRVIESASHVRVVLVPPSEPRTKPKACNFGLTIARGEFLTIYDAEDRPEPLQLRRAVVGFARRGPQTACLQARLSYHNSHQNIITKWFTNEYDTWFMWLLPGLIATGAPVPLGGTSNHIRTKVLVDLAGWDPYNVTEDADLGVRLARFGWSVAVLDSTTYEEANSDFVNWVKQRSRWYKGYLQTWLVHMRQPYKLTRALGVRGAVGFTLFVAGAPILSLLNPIFWGASGLWMLDRPPILTELFPAPLYHLGMACWIIGGLSLIYAAAFNSRASDKPELVGALIILPFYWLMMSLAAIKAAVQLALQPSYWEKTTHGLDRALAVDDKLLDQLRLLGHTETKAGA